MNVVMNSYYGKLLVIAVAQENDTNRSSLYRCRCDCGKETEVIGYNLVSGNSKSCGCTLRKHGYHGTAEYKTWSRMKSRCNDLGNSNYGGRGIRVDSRWVESFPTFLADMGPKPTQDHTLDRIDVEGGYSPENCRWATSEEQSNNRTDNVYYDVDGQRLSQAQLARSVGLSPSTLNLRLKGGMSVEEAIATPLLKIRNELFEHEGRSLSLQQWSEVTGIDYRCLRDRIKRLGWSVAKAVTTQVGEVPKSHPSHFKRT